MRKNTIKVSREQLGILQHLDKESVRYVAVGDFAMLAIDPARMLQQAQLWIEPAKQNLQRLNRAMKSMFGPRTTRQVRVDGTPDAIKSGRQFSLGIGPFRVGIYFGVGGFKPEEFNQVYQRSQAEKVSVPGQPDREFTIRRMSNADLSQQLRAESLSHADWNLKTLQATERQVTTKDVLKSVTVDDHKGQNVPYDTKPGKETNASGEDARISVNQEGAMNHRGQNVPYGQPGDQNPNSVIRDFEEIRQKLAIETVLDQYDFKPTTLPKVNDPWRIYERETDGQAQRIVVGRLKENGQEQFYEAGNRNLRGDVIDLVAALERNNVKPGETLEQCVFRRTDEWLANQKPESNAHETPELRPVSGAYFFGAGATVQEKVISSAHDIKPLDKTTVLEASSLVKAIVYAPEFDGRIRNMSSGYLPSGQSENAIAFPLYDQAGKIADVAAVGWKENGRYTRQQNTTDSADALWQSNRFYRTKADIAVQNEAAIPSNTVGVISRVDAHQLTFHYQEEGQQRRIAMPIQDGRSLFAEQSVTRVVVGQSPIDILAIKQLNPEGPDERRLYVSTIDAPTREQTAHLEQILSKNPQAQLILAANHNAESYRMTLNTLSIAYPAANSTLRVVPSISPIAGSGVAADRDIGLFFYPHEPALRSSEDLLKRFGYHTYGQPLGESKQITGVDPRHLELLLAGKRGITTGTDKPSSYTDNLTIQALATAIRYAELHKIPLSDPLEAIRDTPIMQLLLAENRLSMRQLYEEEYRGKNQLTIELRQPANKPLAEKQNDLFLNRFVSTLTMTANQMQAQTHPQRSLDTALQCDPPVLEMSRQTFRDSQTGQVVTRSSIILPNEPRVLSKATQMVANEINERQGQRLVQVMQPGPHHQTMTDMLAARNGQPLPHTHRLSIGPAESIRPQAEQTAKPDFNSPFIAARRAVAEHAMAADQAVERLRPAVKMS